MPNPQSFFIPFLAASDSNALDYFTASDAVFPGTGFAGVTVRNNHPLVTYDDSASELAYFLGVMGKEYNGGLITLELFWVAESAISGDVEWLVAWERDESNGIDIDADGFAPEKAVVSTAPGTNGVIQKAVLSFTQAEADGVVAGDPYRLRIRRNGGVGSDTMSGDAQLLRVSLEGV